MSEAPYPWIEFGLTIGTWEVVDRCAFVSTLSPHDPHGCPGRGRATGALAAALPVFAAVERFGLLEYPAGASNLATRLTETRLEPGPDGLVRAPTGPALGLRPNLD